MKDLILNSLAQSIAVKKQFVHDNLNQMTACADRLATGIAAGNKILIFGNGGSAADAQHMAAEFVNRFQIERPPLAALALTTDTSILTSIGNDYDFSEVFAKQVRALGKKGDMAIGISTSGNSANVVKGIAAARETGLFTIGFTGPGGALAQNTHMVFRVDTTVTARIQESHIFLAHVLCDLVDRILFPEQFGGNER